jgi:hypothetical protein
MFWRKKKAEVPDLKLRDGFVPKKTRTRSARTGSDSAIIGDSSEDNAISRVERASMDFDSGDSGSSGD